MPWLSKQLQGLAYNNETLEGTSKFKSMAQEYETNILLNVDYTSIKIKIKILKKKNDRFLFTGKDEYTH